MQDENGLHIAALDIQREKGRSMYAARWYAPVAPEEFLQRIEELMQALDGMLAKRQLYIAGIRVANDYPLPTVGLGEDFEGYSIVPPNGLPQAIQRPISLGNLGADMIGELDRFRIDTPYGTFLYGKKARPEETGLLWKYKGVQLAFGTHLSLPEFFATFMQKNIPDAVPLDKFQEMFRKTEDLSGHPGFYL